MIDQEEISTIKQRIELVPFMRSCGIELKQVGKNYRGYCPFHEDSSPSLTVNPKENLWNCFGCDKGGDNIRFVQLYDNVSFGAAVERLKNHIPGGDLHKTRRSKQPTTPRVKNISVKEKKLLARVVNYYQHTFAEDPRGREYLQARGINNPQSMEDFGVGFVRGSLKDILPDDEEVLQILKNLGILNKKGNETLYNCVVFPLYDRDGVINLYGRNINRENQVSEPARLRVGHLYLSGARKGLVYHALSLGKRSSTVLLTESIIDALTLYDQGFTNVVPAYGVNGLTDDHFSLFNSGIKEIYLCFDNDQAGKEGATRVTAQLKKKGIQKVYPVTLPDKDINIFFKRHTPEEFEQLLKKANPKSLEQSDSLDKRKQVVYRDEEHGFLVGYKGRQYQVKGIQRGDTQLKATIKVSKDISGSKNFELTTIDLYSSRSRHWFGKLCADLLQEPEALIKEDLSKLLEQVEAWQPSKKEETRIEVPQKDKELALSILKSTDIFSELLADFDTLGVTGEETNKLVGYLAATSRKLADPLSVLIQSRSAAGKSTLQDAVLSLIPAEDFIKYTRVTDQALFYKEENSLVNKILAIEEAEGMGGAAYSIRNIQSAGQITVAATGKDPGTGKMRTEEYTVNGPVCVMITTTATEIDQETASRFIFLTIDESSEMTEAIHRMQRQAESLEGLIRDKKQEIVVRKHHAAQRILKPLSVVNPYAEYLSYPSHSLRSRRDHKKYLGLIRAIAFLHQQQREIKTVEVEGEPVEYIEATLADIEAANRLANEVLGQSMDELAKPSRTLLSQIIAMVKELAGGEENLDTVYFTRRMIREYTNWTDWQVKSHIKQLEDLEYLTARIGSKGKEYSYVLNYQGEVEEDDGQKKCYLNLTPVEEIKKNSESALRSAYLEGK